MTKTQDVVFWHNSGQFSDDFDQQTADARKVFALGGDVYTGTEAGPDANNHSKALRQEGKAAGYWVYCAEHADHWVAVKKTFAASKPIFSYIPCLDSANSVGDPHHYGPRGLVTAEFDTTNLGHFSVGASHFLTLGRFKGQSHKDNPKCHFDHFTANRKLAGMIGDWAAKADNNRKLAFVGIDTNVIDRIDDVFYGVGGPLLTSWDELKNWQNTGHGNIDVIARSKADGRVKPVSASAFSDKKVRLNSDHFIINTTYRVQKLK